MKEVLRTGIDAEHFASTTYALDIILLKSRLLA